MTKLKFGLISAVVIAGVATPLVLQHQAELKLREENRAFQAQVEQLTGENDRVSNLLARRKSPKPEATEQMSELLKLRGEVGRLRQQSNQLHALQNENRRLQATAAKASGSGQSAESQSEFPRESWSFTGYATPPSAFQSLVWSMSTADVTNALGSMSPGEREKMRTRMEGKTDAEIAASIAGDLQNTKRFRVLENNPVSENETVLRIQVEGEATPETVLKQRARMVKIGNEWKFDGWAKR